MIDDGAPEDRDRHRERHELEGDAGGAPAEGGSTVDDDRHYRQDPGALLESARDEDEHDEDDRLELDRPNSRSSVWCSTIRTSQSRSRRQRRSSRATRRVGGVYAGRACLP